MADNSPNLASDLLKALGVNYTSSYTSRQFEGMTFKTLFGVAKMLELYKVECAAYVLEDRDAIDSLDEPFVVQIGNDFAVVDEITPDSVSVIVTGQRSTMARDDFMNRWTGVVMLAFTDGNSSEPGYAAHRFTEIAIKAKRWVLAAMLTFIGIYFFVANGLWRHWATVVLTLFDLAGIYISYLLLLKSMHITSSTADAVCGVLQRHGCDKILERKASTFFGIFGWSAVGFSYFTVSLVALLVAPQSWVWLAWIGVCALPFTVWSISYQHFVAHTWCTLCVTVQTLLWLEFFCFLFGGMYANPFPLTWTPAILIAAYIAALLSTDVIENSKLNQRPI